MSISTQTAHAVKALILSTAVVAILAGRHTALADLPGPPPGAPPGPTFFLPGEDVDDASGAPTKPGPLAPVGDTTKPNVPNVVFYDFGSVSTARSEPIKHDFVLRNRSNSVIAIDHLQPGCGCVSAKIGPGIVFSRVIDGSIPVFPGAEFTVHTSIDPKQLYVGKINKIVWIYFPGDKSPAFTMHIIGHVTAMANFDPQSIDLGSVNADTDSSKRVTVTTDTSVYGPNPPDPISADASVKIVRDTMPRTVHGTQVSRVYLLRLTHRAHLGMLQDIVAMPLPHGANGVGPSLLVTGTVEGDISATPGSVAFGALTAGQQSRQTVALSGTASALNGLKVTCSDQSLKVRILRDPAKSTTLCITIRSAKPGPIQSTIALTIRNGQELDLPVYGWVK